jgi:glutamate synthase (NADPH/NADH) large chain
MRTGRDVVVGALLGAEEFGFSTGPLVALGCLMMRKCHLNTCPVGIATQDPELRKRFAGAPEHVIRYLFFVAEEVRTILASLGFRRLDEAVGRVECIAPKKPEGAPVGSWWKARRLDFSEVLYRPKEAATSPLRCTEPVAHNLDAVLDRALAPRASAALERGERVSLETAIRNSDRAFGAMLSGEIARRHGDIGLADDTLTITAHGSAGQSFGAFGAPGLTLALWGDANDYVGKGLSGAVLAICPPEGSPFEHEAQVIVGNTVLYGATRGRAFFNGRAGERFAVRNSGAAAVVEGVGDHGCEYMTGGTVVVLGSTGRNFAAGMSGGVAYVFDEDGGFASRCNPDTVALEPLGAEDVHALHSLVEEHARRTGSPKAKAMLSRWAESAERFVKVMPEELRKALMAQRAKAEGAAQAEARA